MSKNLISKTGSSALMSGNVYLSIDNAPAGVRVKLDKDSAIKHIDGNIVEEPGSVGGIYGFDRKSFNIAYGIDEGFHSLLNVDNNEYEVVNDLINMFNREENRWKELFNAQSILDSIEAYEEANKISYEEATLVADAVRHKRAFVGTVDPELDGARIFSKIYKYIHDSFEVERTDAILQKDLISVLKFVKNLDPYQIAFLAKKNAS